MLKIPAGPKRVQESGIWQTKREESVKKTLQSLSVGSVALACIFVSGTTAHAAEGHGKRYGGCTNHVKVWRSGGKVYAQGKMVCNQRNSILRPNAALSSYSGGNFKDINRGSGLNGCHRAKTCTSKKVSLKAHKGWSYRGTNDGTASIRSANPADIVWPKNTIAVATYKYR